MRNCYISVATVELVAPIIVTKGYVIDDEICNARLVSSFMFR
jgi:hypothetical protein